MNPAEPQSTSPPSPHPQPQQQLIESPRPPRDTMRLLEMVLSNSNPSQANFAKDLIQAEIARDAFDQDYRMAKVFAASGEFGDMKDKTEFQGIATAMAKIQLGRHWGLLPPDAMRFVHFNNGKPSLEAEAIALKLMEAGWEWDLEFPEEKGVCIGCVLWPKRRDANGTVHPLRDKSGNPVSISFGKAEAEKALYWENKQQKRLIDKWNYQSWAADMYFARCITRLKKRYASNILSGVITPDEAADAGETDIPVGSQADADRVAQEKIEDLRRRGFKVVEVKSTPVKDAPQVAQHTTPINKGQGKETATAVTGETESAKASGTNDEIPGPASPGIDVIATMRQWMEGLGPEKWSEILLEHGYEVPTSDEEVLQFTTADIEKLTPHFASALRARTAATPPARKPGRMNL